MLLSICEFCENRRGGNPAFILFANKITFTHVL
jgi:hypothetical protein